MRSTGVMVVGVMSVSRPVLDSLEAQPGRSRSSGFTTNGVADSLYGRLRLAPEHHEMAALFCRAARARACMQLTELWHQH